MVNIGNDWNEILKDEFSKEYYLKLRAFLKSEYKSHCIHPDMYDIFNALKWNLMQIRRLSFLVKTRIMK